MSPDRFQAARQAILGLLAEMTDEQRQEVFNGLDAYCRLCGTDNPNCFCDPGYDE